MSMVAFFGLFAYLRKSYHLSEDVRFKVDGLRNKKWPSIAGRAILGDWTDNGKRLKQACQREASNAQRIRDGTFAVRKAVFFAKNEREAKDQAVNDEINHEEKTQRLKQTAKNLAENIPKVNDQRVQRSTKPEDVLDPFLVNTERSSKAAEEAQHSGAAEPAEPFKEKRSNLWNKDQIARAKEALRAVVAAKAKAKKKDDEKRSREEKATKEDDKNRNREEEVMKTVGMEGRGNPEEDWQKNQLERLAEMKAGQI